MTMSTVVSIISVLVGFALSMTATALLSAALFPQWVARSRRAVQTRPWRCLLTGLILGGLCLVIAGVVSRGGGPAGFFGAMLAAGVLGTALCGSAGVAEVIGSGLPSPADHDRPWRAIVRGWLVLSLASLLPILGWFVFLPAALFIGLGAAVWGVFGRRSAPAAGPPSPAALILDQPPFPDGPFHEGDEWAGREQRVSKVETGR